MPQSPGMDEAIEKVVCESSKIAAKRRSRDRERRLKTRGGFGAAGLRSASRIAVCFGPASVADRGIVGPAVVLAAVTTRVRSCNEGNVAREGVHLVDGVGGRYR